ncbi:AraC family transcriptional regulator [Gramella jeungdoensis]|uniref:AraC family transcriptional regulator n=1 Tax=Gramella jeungdoensis TaxID=708091 RepID=A0ABT0Z3M4_9FLAO|nr:helix-turn-helix domain-containing protein [Gramella jeungdoensis]MCM8570332.1 AraC family transcriptional regulator [Gramella jeungdoensis]
MKTTVLDIDQFKKSKVLKDLYVNSFSNHIQTNRNLISKPHSHNFYLCVLFTEGTGVHEIDFTSYEIKPGKIFFLKPGQTHFWKFYTKPNGFIFFHSQDFYELNYITHSLSAFPFYYSYQNPPFLDISQNDGEVLNKYHNLYKEYVDSKLFRELKIINIISDIYITLTRKYTSNVDLTDYSPSSYLKILENLENFIDNHYDEQKLPKFYANKLNITTKHLNRVVKETVNKTTNQLISERVILEAKRLIIHSNNSLSSIAFTLGFSDYAYFSRYFKNKSGLTPNDFRKSYGKI